MNRGLKKALQKRDPDSGVSAADMMVPPIRDNKKDL